MQEKDEAKKAELHKEYFTKTLPEYLAVLEGHLKKNGGGHGFFVGSNPTWADFEVATFLFTANSLNPGILDKFPLLKEHVDRVHGLKGIKEHVAKRPDSPM